MHLRNIIPAFLALFPLAWATQASPRIVFYEYTPPPPVLQLSSITPTDQQVFFASQPPGSVEVIYSLPIDPAKSDLKVYDQYNMPLAGSLNMIGDTHMSLQLPPHLLSEIYRVDWKGTCTCQGNPTISGTIHFTVN